jgi:hypothetical protein
MRGKLGEDLKVVLAHNPAAFQTTSVTMGRGSIDTQGYKEALAILNLGTINAGVTLGVKLYENSADDWTTAIPVTGGILLSNGTSSTTITASIVGNILTESRKRYLWIGAILSGPVTSATQSAAFSCSVILGKKCANPCGGTLTIDLE